MTSLRFAWKKTATDKVQKASSAFENRESERDCDRAEKEDTTGSIDWVSLLPKNKEKSKENPNQKCERLYEEGTILAEEERFWEAIKRWDEALRISPKNEKLHEMKSQVLMELGEIYPALESAEKSVQLKPNWAVALQTLGRAQLNIGDIQKALKSFERAKHLRPDDPELWNEDMAWTRSLINQKKQMDDDIEMMEHLEPEESSMDEDEMD